MHGSALPTVLVTGTLMLLAVFVVISLGDMESLMVYGRYSHRQKEAWLESALLLYSQDSTLMNWLDENGRFLLFEDDPVSEITLSRSPWGLYELVKTSAGGGRYRKAVLTGYESESPKQAALYVSDNLRAFTLAGKSQVKGTVYLPENGLIYGQVQSDFYSREPLPELHIRKSSGYFPPRQESTMDSLKNLWYGAANILLPDNYELRNSFFEPVIRLRSENLSGVTVQGHVVIRSPNRIEIDSTSRLEDVLVVAPKVFIREGFSGALQIVASDSVLVERRVRLKYPSGIVIPEGNADSAVELAEGSEINGYVIFRSAAEPPEEKRTPHYRQQPQSRVRGLVWVDGIAQIQGTVTGSLYVNQANYYGPQGYYTNLLYQASVYRSEAMAFPVWMQNNYPRKIMKWLD